MWLLDLRVKVGDSIESGDIPQMGGVDVVAHLHDSVEHAVALRISRET